MHGGRRLAGGDGRRWKGKGGERGSRKGLLGFFVVDIRSQRSTMTGSHANVVLVAEKDIKQLYFGPKQNEIIRHFPSF